MLCFGNMRQVSCNMINWFHLDLKNSVNNSLLENSCQPRDEGLLISLHEYTRKRHKEKHIYINNWSQTHTKQKVALWTDE